MKPKKPMTYKAWVTETLAHGTTWARGYAACFLAGYVPTSKKDKLQFVSEGEGRWIYDQITDALRLGTIKGIQRPDGGLYLMVEDVRKWWTDGVKNPLAPLILEARGAQKTERARLDDATIHIILDAEEILRNGGEVHTEGGKIVATRMADAIINKYQDIGENPKLSRQRMERTVGNWIRVRDIREKSH